MFQDCEYKTNVYAIFKSHKFRKHSCAVNIFKPGIVKRKERNTSENLCSNVVCDSDISDVESVQGDADYDSALDRVDPEILEKDIELKIASVLLKLENIFLVSSTAVDELLQELSYFISSLSLPIAQNTISQDLQDHGCQFDQSVVEKLASVLWVTNPVKKAIGDKGPLSSGCRQKVYYKSHFNVVEPVEYILDQKNNKSYQYISILQSLQQILDCQPKLDQAGNLNAVYKQQQESCQAGWLLRSG